MRSHTVTIVAAMLACAVLAVGGCSDDDTDQDRPTRIVCVEGGKTVLDDFAKKGSIVNVSGAYLNYTSETQQGSVAAIGNCVSRPQTKPAGWKPIFPG